MNIGKQKQRKRIMSENKLYYVDGTKLHYNGGRFYRYEDEGYSEDLHFHFYSKVTTPLHAHDYFEIFIITHGSVIHTFKGDTKTLEEGTLCLIAPYEQHQFLLTGGEPVHFNISIPAGEFERFCDSLGVGIYSKLIGGTRIYRMKPREYEYFKFLTEGMLSSEVENSYLLAKTVAVNAITQLVTFSAEGEQQPEWFRAFCEKIKSSEYFLQPINQLYKLVPYSQPILNSTFKQFMSETLISYLTKARINYAANLLVCSNYSILEISEMTGYNSLSHFNHTFKRTLGYTPSEYRRMYGKKSAD